MTALAILFYGMGLLAFGLNDVLLFGFNAHHNNMDSMKIGWVRVLVNIVLNAALVTTLGLAGLALATTLSGYIKLGLLLVVYQHKYGRIFNNDWWPWFGKIVLATLFMSATILFYQIALHSLLDAGSFWLQMGYLSGGLTLAAIVFFMAAIGFQIEELISVKEFTKTQLKLKIGFQE